MPEARFLAIFFPAFRLERCGYDASTCAVLIGMERNAMRVVALTPEARRCGLHLGMSVSEARSIEPQVNVDLLDLVGEAVDRGELIGVFERISDQVQAVGPQCLVLEISQTAEALGGEPRTQRRAHSLAVALGHEARIAITDDPLAAAALARHTSGGIIPAGEMAQALAPLPLGAFGASERLVGALQALGIDTMDGLTSLDIASVTGRFGVEGLHLHRLAGGTRTRMEDVSIAWSAEALPRVSAPLAGATTTLQLQFVLPGLLTQLARALAERDLAAVQLRCVLILEAGSPVGFGVRVGRPTRDVSTLEHLVRSRLATVRIRSPIEEWRIEVQEAVQAHGWQPGLTDRTEANEPLPDVLARLQDALGDDAVFAAEPHNSWCPERSWRAAPFQLHPPLRRPPALSQDVVDVQERWELGLRWARPSQLLEKPLPLELHQQDGRPIRLLLSQGWRKIVRSEGPEALSGAWWSPDDVWERRYWVVEFTDGATAWIYQSDHHWWLHGWF